MLKIEGLSHKYTHQWAVKGINIDISGNGVFGLLGANGAGKSTIMNIVCGSLTPSEGKLYINDIDIEENALKAKSYLGYLPQNPPLYGDLTVEEYLNYCGQLHDIPKEELQTSVEAVMERCSITHFRNRLINNLSGGYKQRVGIAQAIIHRPKLVIFDEPTNGLDPNQILYVRNLIRDLATECTVVISTHILREVEALCSYIYMLNNGSMVFNGTIESFYNKIRPTSLLATFMAQPTRAEIMAIEGVSDVEELGGNHYRILFEGVDADAIAQEVTKYSVKRSWMLSELQSEGGSIDAIFALLSKHR